MPQYGPIFTPSDLPASGSGPSGGEFDGEPGLPKRSAHQGEREKVREALQPQGPSESIAGPVEAPTKGF